MNPETLAHLATPAPIAPTTTNFQPRQDVLYVQRTSATEECYDTGILLPECMQEPYDEGTVLAAGPGKLFKNGVTTVMWASPGDRVIFTPEAWEEIDGRKDAGLGLVRDRKAAAIIRRPFFDEVEPLNGWVMVKRDPAPELSLFIVIPEKARRAPCSGIILRLGPGDVREKGSLAGCRLRIADQLGKPNLVGARCHWRKEAVTIALTGDDGRVSATLVHVADLLAVDEE